MDKQKIQITVPANLQHSSLVRNIADEVFGAAKFSKIWRSRLKLVVDELFMNAVRYGSTQDASSVYISFLYGDDEVKFVIEDDGTGPNAIPADELEKIIHKNESNTDLTRTSGRGLSMITKSWTDSMEIEKSARGGILVAFTKKVETVPPPPSLPDPASLVGQVIQKSEPSVQPSVEPAEKPSLPQKNADAPVYEIKLSGEIDQSNIEKKLEPVYDTIQTIPNGSVLALDFSETSYINSIFIGTLASFYKAMEKKNGRLRLNNLNKQIKEVLELVGLLSVIELEDGDKNPSPDKNTETRVTA